MTPNSTLKGLDKVVEKSMRFYNPFRVGFVDGTNTQGDASLALGFIV
jgi:hypothetical protein